MKKRTLCVWLVDWAVQRRLAHRPKRRDSSARDGVLVLYETIGGRGCRVTARSPTAARHGIAVGMSLAEAHAMLGPTPARCFEADDPVANRVSLENLARWCQRYSPWVSLESADRPESLFLDIAGCSHLWGGEDRLARAVIDELSAYGLWAREAIADTPGASWALAHYGSGRASVESSIEPDSTFLIVTSEAMRSALATLPVAALRLAAETIGVLRELGIERIGQLESLTRARLTARLGEELLTKLDHAMGRVPEKTTPLDQPAALQARWNLEDPIEHVPAVLDIVGRLLASLFHQLPLGWGLLQFDVRLKHDGKIEPHTIPVGLCRPSCTTSHLLELAHLALQKTRLAGPVTEVKVHVRRTAPFEFFQPTLFESDAAGPVQREVDRLVERLTSRLGRGRVLVPRLIADAQPERACEYAPALGRSTNRRDARTFPCPRRPLRLFRRPERIHVHVSQPSGAPASYRREREDETISNAWGPERIETGWWRGKPIGRDYYRIELASGSLLWIFRDLTTHCWFLHGAFE